MMVRKQFPWVKPICHKCKIEFDWIMFRFDVLDIDNNISEKNTLVYVLIAIGLAYFGFGFSMESGWLYVRGIIFLSMGVYQKLKVTSLTKELEGELKERYEKMEEKYGRDWTEIMKEKE